MHCQFSNFRASTDPRGELLGSIFTESYLCLLNNGLNIFCQQFSSTLSAIDLSAIGPTVLLDFNWTVHDDLFGNYNVPIIFTTLEQDKFL